MRLLEMTVLMAILAGPAAAGPALDRLMKEAGGVEVSPEAAPAARPIEASPEQARQSLSHGELSTLQFDKGGMHPLPPAGVYGQSKDPNWRKLTPGEIELLKPIFRDGVNYSKVWIYRGKWNPFQPDNTIMAPNGYIYWPPSAGYSPDFSSYGSRYFLVHEMTHVYQHQQGINVIGRRLSEGGVYSYSLDPAKTMNDYTIEQQGNMVADYYECTVSRWRSADECRRRFSPTMAGFLDDAHWLGKDEERRRRLEEPERFPRS